jgi:hypothetical protein
MEFESCFFRSCIQFNGNHIRVDAAHAPNGKVDGKDMLSYDHTRSAFVGNLPFDVKVSVFSPFRIVQNAYFVCQ